MSFEKAPQGIAMTLQQTVRSPRLETERATTRDHFVAWLVVSFLALHGGAVVEMTIGGVTGSFGRNLLWFVVAPAFLIYTVRRSSERRW